MAKDAARPDCLRFAYFKWSPHVFVFWFSLAFSAAGVDTDTFFGDWQRELVAVRNEIQARVNRGETTECSCAYHACGPKPDESITECLRSNHSEDLDCGANHCGHMKVGAVRETSNQVSIGSYSEEVKRDICLTEGLASTFKTARGASQGFAPWMYFGATETGTFVSWPGKPRRQLNDSTCAPYDPRVRPWWGWAAWRKRNVVILLDLSETMGDNLLQRSFQRWGLAMDMIEKLLTTLTEGDSVQVVTFKDSPSTLFGEEMLQATADNVESIRRRLKRIEPDWEDNVDIGNATRLAFDLLNDNPHDQKCDNHIVLFTDSRDCTTSTMKDCEAKIYGNEQNSEFVRNATALTLSYVEYRQEKLKEGLPPVTLFSYSLSPDANGMMSQLACRLNGIHVDLERELRNGILDPFHLMRGYFRRAALPIAKAFGEDGMAISDMYEDDGGLGRMNTLVMPVFFQPHDKCPPIHYGVIGADLPTSEYDDSGVQSTTRSFQLSVDNWNTNLSSCRADHVSVCEMQVLRGEEAQCVFHQDGRRGRRCYGFQDHYYFVDDENLQSLVAAKDFCEQHRGELIAPRDAAEKRFLATVIPPDGAWINLTQTGSVWRWPDGEELEQKQRDSIERTCKQAWSAGFFMDPRSFDDNFQCSQSVAFRTVVCRFPNISFPAVCGNQADVAVVTEDNFNNTIHTCGMDDCLLESISFEQRQNPICDWGRNDLHNFNSIACCSEEDLDGVCEEDSEKSDTRFNIVPIIIAIIAAAVASAVIVCSCWLWYKTWLKPKATKAHTHLTSTESSHRNNLELVAQSRNQPIRSSLQFSLLMPNYVTVLSLGPFENAPCKSPSVGKRPELVVNIEVKLLDNGWEKSGGYGRVRQGEYTDATGNVHKVAVKFVDALAPTAAWEALKNEFDILASIPLHPNIVKPIGAHYGDRCENSNRYIVEELMHTNLGDLMSETEPPPYPGKIMLYKDWIKIFIDIARGLEHLHLHKVIHFDLKPRNVLLDEQMTAKIADFGCSKSKFDTYIELSQMGGTPPYLAPECWMLYYAQNCRTEVARAKIDVYSFGVIMWECLSGGSNLRSALYRRTDAEPSSSSRSPAHADNIEIIRDTQSGERGQHWVIQYHLRDEIPEGLRDLVNQCVRVDFDARPTCIEILDTLEPMLHEEWAEQPLLFS